MCSRSPITEAPTPGCRTCSPGCTRGSPRSRSVATTPTGTRRRRRSPCSRRRYRPWYAPIATARFACTYSAAACGSNGELTREAPDTRSAYGHQPPESGAPRSRGHLTVTHPLVATIRFRPSLGFPGGKDSRIVKLRLLALASTALVVAAAAAPAAHAASNTVVLSQVVFRGPVGGNDEFIQIKNASPGAVDISGWQIWGSNNTGSATSARATVPANTALPAGKSYLFTNAGASGYSLGVPGDVTYSSGIADNGGVQLRSAAG